MSQWVRREHDGVTAEARVVDLGPRGEIATGVCFLDHMIDQLTAHAQLGVSVRVSLPQPAATGTATAAVASSSSSGGSGGGGEWLPAHRDYAGGLTADSETARPHDRGIFAASGAALGAALRLLVEDARAAKAAPKAEAAAKAAKQSGGGAEAEAPPTKKRRVASRGRGGGGGSESTFFCPLDEAFTEARVTLPVTGGGDGSTGECGDGGDGGGGGASETLLAPYGTMPPQGRTWIGCYRCDLTPLFWTSLAAALGAGAAVKLRKVRGSNAHHIVESTFKAFARAFRAALDDDNEDEDEEGVPGRGSVRNGCVAPFEDRVVARHRAAVASAAFGGEGAGSGGGRSGAKSRSTKETSIDVAVDLDAPAPRLLKASEAANGASSTSLGSVGSIGNIGGGEVSTGVALLDALLEEFRAACGFDFKVACTGDTYIDDHHTAEDVSITLGQCLLAGLGDKAGLARMGCAEAEAAAPEAPPAGAASAFVATAASSATGGESGSSVGTARVRVVIDLSNRPHFESNLEEHLDEEFVGGQPARHAAAAAAGGGGGEEGGDGVVCGRALTSEMLVHVFESLTLEMRATGHVQVLQSGAASPSSAPVEGHTLNVALAMARAYGAALAECVRVDPRRAGKVASSKGTLSV